MRRHLHKTVAVTAIHPQLGNVDIVWKRHRLDWLITDPGIFRRNVVPGGGGQTAHDQNAGDRHLQRQPIAPAWKKVRHRISGRPVWPNTAANLKTSVSCN